MSGRDMHLLYASKKSNDIDIDYKVWQNHKGELQLIWRIPEGSISTRTNNAGDLVSGVAFRYKVFYNYSEELALDSGAVVLSNLIQSHHGAFIDTIDLPISQKRRHVVDIQCKDLNSSKLNTQFVDVDLSSSFSNLNSLLFLSSNQLNFKNYVTNYNDYEVEISIPQTELFVRYYNRDFVLASAPFAVVTPKPFDFKPDHSFKISRGHNNRFVLPIHKSGLYQISNDSSTFEGPCFSFFNEFYPQPMRIEELLNPLRYITTTDEYRDLNSGDNLKKNIDSYWLKIAGSSARAKELIRAYYSRVEAANRLFASYLEGWKSDRGMCFIIYGEPDLVYKSTSSETWIYGEKGITNSLSLTFTKVSNPFSSNDFRLNRSNALKSSWYRAVEFWRQGRIITYK